MIHSTRIKAIDNSTIKDGADDKRKIPDGLFKPHMTTLIAGKTGCRQRVLVRTACHLLAGKSPNRARCIEVDQYPR